MITIRDLLCGVAVGDAIGYPLEFLRNPNKNDFENSMNAKILNASDDTQMTLFLAEAIANYGINFAPDLPYIRWYSTQNRFKENSHLHDGLLSFECLYNLREPGNTCMSACNSLSKGEKVINDSKGNGTVMRISPWALKAAMDDKLDYSHYAHLVRKDSLATHKHPEATESATALFLILYFLVLGVKLEAGLILAIKEIDSYSRTYELLLKVINGELLDLEGWVAEEALYIALSSVFRSTDYLTAIYNASVISGDSDTCASIAGAIAMCSGMEIPSHFIDKLDVLPAINYVSDCW
ncbi:ADP-ribosylglycohydrolase family protein [Nitrosomonas communis]|uniref:ADP-ribosylglycohydrolase n=1 Tax=Nitrosomonas communis TaxID=44574 RepID=A0A1I4Q6S4_9PROT|nr:ADP-ribosylglycohydrolase family protein [Nitrosomonas communis]SFM35769.1 ADP-ribosylglycohydrolase [Nitrosomonas communis]